MALPPLDALADISAWYLREDQGRDQSFLSVKNENLFIMDFFLALIDLVKYCIIIHLDSEGLASSHLPHLSPTPNPGRTTFYKTSWERFFSDLACCIVSGNQFGNFSRNFSGT